MSDKERMNQLAKQIQHNDVTRYRMAIAELVELVLTEYLMKSGHTEHCAKRQVWGDGECECIPEGRYDTKSFHS